MITYMETNRPWQVWSYAPGETMRDFQPFDILLTRRMDTFMGKAISFFDGGFFSHAAIGYGATGFLAESLEWGVEVEHINKYREHFYTIVRLPDLSKDEKDRMQDSMDSTLWNHDNAYAYPIILSILLRNVTGLPIRFGDKRGVKICSGFDCITLDDGIEKLDFPEPPAYMTPNGMARFFQIPQPSKDMQKYHKLGYIENHTHLGGSQPA